MTSTYKSAGSRKSFEVNETCKLTEPEDDDMIEYIVISNGSTVEAHSLDPYAEW